ncbi:DUF5007 domain-containing protein [Dysgonomonas sp. GY75]|uniref:DUF5007 domain-containing protein n=1 Tax=Dysgonomonas sp. GY75 TaxID=2780419 RepID=UPI001884049F|nr:DUF5007 domain-containing protein [Dysgonomonas sp. GY75]MBF0648215.1 DUF5007 domain-containing protein [Dysgonomonas sp. GY75]
MNRKKKYIKQMYLTGASALLLLNTSCVNNYLPDIQDAFDRDVNYTERVYRPVLGRTTFYTNNFQPGNSTQPLAFEITRIVKADGSPAPEMTDVFPVKIWTKPYLGNENSIEEIEAKRSIEYRSLFQVREYSGELVMWANAASSFVDCAPGKGYLFDVKVSNKGGYKYFNNLQLVPVRENDYEPTIYDPETGLILDKDYITATRASLVELESGRFTSAQGIQVYLREDKENSDEKKSITFRFYNSDYTPIPPEKFNKTEWDNLLHGFNKKMGENYVKYDVAYPLPLVKTPSKYTNSIGDMVKLRFAYDRITSSGYRRNPFFELEFAIYKEAHWEVIIVFADGAPEFRDNI